MVPAKPKLLPVNKPIAVLIKDLKDVSCALLSQGIDMAFVIAEQRLADQTEFFEVQFAIPEGLGSVVDNFI